MYLTHPRPAHDLGGIITANLAARENLDASFASRAETRER